MQPARNELDEPLGQNGQPSPPPSRGLLSIAIFLTLCALAAVSVAGAVVLREGNSPIPLALVLPNAKSGLQIAASEKQKPEPDKPGDVKPSEFRFSTTAFTAPTLGAQDYRKFIVVRDPAEAGQDLRVAHLPDRSLIEQSELGPLPVRAADGRRPFDVYARPWSGARGARIAIVIGGLGISQTGTQEAIKRLPPEITLAFAPLGNSLARWMQEARHDGHEIIMQVPLEPVGYPSTNPGRYTLLTTARPDKNITNLRWVLGRTTNYTGVMNYMGGRFTADRKAMDLLFDELGRRGLLYFDDGTSARSVAEKVALAKGVPFVAGDAVIDQERERGAILKKLDELERIARAKGFAVGSGIALDATVEAVSIWAAEIRKRGIELVPISAVANDPERGEGG
jgi:Uncharacterized protein conserved in bacteria